MDLDEVKQRVFSLSFFAIIVLLGIFIAVGTLLVLGNPKNPDSVLNPNYTITHPRNSNTNPNLGNPSSGNSNSGSEAANSGTNSDSIANNNSSITNLTDNGGNLPPGGSGTGTPANLFCGDGNCLGAETCANCSQDCGNCADSDCTINNGICRSACRGGESVFPDAQDCGNDFCCVKGLV